MGGEAPGAVWRNNFTLIRVLAAAAVIFDHAYRLVGAPPPLTGFLAFTDIGTLAVCAFFAVSGHLLLGSWKANPRPLLFASKRFLRIVPGSTFAVVFALLIVGPLMTSLSVSAYLQDQMTRDYLWNLIFFRQHYDLPGVFGHNPFPAINGSTWTLAYEISLYCAMPLIAFLLLRRQRWVGAALLLGAVALPWDRLGAVVPVTLLQVRYLEPFARYFVIGAVLYAFRDRVPMRWYLGVALAAVLIASFGHPWAPWVTCVVLPYEVVYLAQVRPPRGGLLQRRDPSYGMYLLAFPVEQGALSLAGGHLHPLVLFAVSVPVTVALALVSWHLVEAPAMKFRGFVDNRKAARRTLVLEPALRRRLGVTLAAAACSGAAIAVGVDGIQHLLRPDQVVSAASVRPPAAGVVPAAAPMAVVGAPVPMAVPAPAAVRIPPLTAAPRPRPVLIYLHGLGESPLHPALADLLNAATADGYQVVFTDEGGPSTWGNRAAVDAIAALKARYSPGRPISLIGCSMGTLALANYVAAAAPGSVSAAVGLLPYSHLPIDEHQDTVTASGAPQPPQTISIPYQVWYGTNDAHTGFPTIHGPRVSLVAMPGAGHSLPIPYNIGAILGFLDTHRAR
jgi:peptidoglycan/LPS O-acetylase OafA/YrhL